MDENNNYLKDAENTEGIDAPIVESTDNNDTVPVTENSIESNMDSTKVEAPVDYEPVQIPESPQKPITKLPDNIEYNNKDVSEKKSKLVPVLIGVIAVLLVGVGVLGGVLLSKNKGSSSNDKTDGNEQQTTETSTEAPSEPTVKSGDIQKAANSVLIEMDEENPNSINGHYLISSDKSKNYNIPNTGFDIDAFYHKTKYFFDEVDSYEWFVAINNGNVESAAIGNSWDTKAFGSEDTLQVLYDKAIEEVKKAADNKGTQQQDQYTADEVSKMYSAFISENPDPNHTYDDPRYGYYLIDLNEDGNQELLITTEEVEAGSPGVVAAYAINNKKLTQLWITDSRFIGYLCEGNIINSFTAMGQGNGTALYQYKSGDKLDLIDMISSDYSSGSEVIYHNQEVISKAEADSILAQYKKMKFEAKPLTISSTSESKTEPPTQADSKENYAFYGIVSTESGSLNLRDKPSADSNVVAQLEKGTKGSVYTIEGYSDWYKFYSDQGQSGYVSAQYIKEYKETDTSQGGNNSGGDSSYTPPTEVNISLNKSTPIEFSEYDGETLISTIRLDKVEYDLKIYDPYKHSDTDYDRYYIDLRFYFTKTYDRYSNEQRYSTNPGVYFNIKDLTDGTIWRSSSFSDQDIIANITPYGMKREGDSDSYKWSSNKGSYSKSLILNSTHQYVINIMDSDEAYAR